MSSVSSVLQLLDAEAQIREVLTDDLAALARTGEAGVFSAALRAASRNHRIRALELQGQEAAPLARLSGRDDTGA